MIISNSTKIVIGLSTIVVLMGILLLRGCSNQIDFKAEKNKLQQTVDSISKLEASTHQAIAAQESLIKFLNDSIHGINQRKAITEKKLKASQDNAVTLSKEVRMAKLHRDTVAYYASCDSLSTMVDSLVSIQTTEKAEYDSLGTFYNQVIARKDSIAEKQQVAYTNIKTMFNNLVEDQYKCLQDANKLQKKANREKTLSRVVAGIAAGLAVAFIIKK